MGVSVREGGRERERERERDRERDSKRENDCRKDYNYMNVKKERRIKGLNYM